METSGQIIYVMHTTCILLSTKPFFNVIITLVLVKLLFYSVCQCSWLAFNSFYSLAFLSF